MRHSQSPDKPPDGSTVDEPSRAFATPCDTASTRHAATTAAHTSARGRAGAQRLICACQATRDHAGPRARRCLLLRNNPFILSGFLPHRTPSLLPPKHTLQPQPDPLGPRPRRRRVEVPHQVLVVARVAAGGQHAARGGLGRRGGRVLAEVPVAQEGDEGVDLCCWVLAAVGPGELVRLG